MAGAVIFVDGNVNYPSCRCKPDCEMPCWQLDGLTDEPCDACGCKPFDYRTAFASIPPKTASGGPS